MLHFSVQVIFFSSRFVVFFFPQLRAYNRADVLPLFETVTRLLKSEGKFIFAFNNRKQKTYDVLQQYMPEVSEIIVRYVVVAVVAAGVLACWFVCQ